MSSALCNGTGRYYVARDRLLGQRRWNVISRHKTYPAAVKAMAKRFAQRAAARADVVLCADYYAPLQLCELVRR